MDMMTTFTIVMMVLVGTAFSIWMARYEHLEVR